MELSNFRDFNAISNLIDFYYQNYNGDLKALVHEFKQNLNNFFGS